MRRINLRRGRAICGFLLLVSVVGCSTPLERRFHTHVAYLASDRLAGRGVGTEGIELAAEYIAERFAGYGLEPAGDHGTYFQTFPIALRRTLGADARLALAGETEVRELGRDFIPFSFSSSDEFSGGVVFCGYGIEAEEKSHDDFSGVDLNGQVALMLRGEPTSWVEENQGRPTRHAMFRNKVYNVRDRGAVAVLIVNQAPTEPGEADQLTEFRETGAEAYGLPAFHVSRGFAQTMLERGGLGSLEELQQRLDAGSFVSAPLGHVKVNGKADVQSQSAPTRNVVAMLPGSGPNSDECVVIGAHYDHLGIQRPMTRRFRGGELVRETHEPAIHHGADDNASGVAALLEIARIAAQERGRNRSLVFIAFTAEEIGLHGSTYYVGQPACDPAKTVAMLNMDMVGRMDPESQRVTVFGAKTGAGIEEVLMSEAARLGLTIETTTDGGGRSDHAPFIRKEIPAMHFFTGIHADYHQPTDTADKINAKGGAAITRLVAHVALDLANRPDRPAFQAVKVERRDQAASDSTPGYRVVMGLTPGYGEGDRPGLKVEAVTPEGPAEVAGMMGGDLIVKIDGKDVANIYDYMGALRKNKPGDRVEVVVIRGGEEKTLSVTLAPAR
jgi:hypothetical protein